MFDHSIVKTISACVSNNERADKLEARIKQEGLHHDYAYTRPRNHAAPEEGNTNLLLTTGANAPLLVMAHYDAVARNGRSLPGAADNASGVSLVVELAKKTVGRPIDYAFFGGEESLLKGARSYYQDLIATGQKRPRGVISIDTIGIDATNLIIPRETGSYRNDETLAHLLGIYAQEQGFAITNDFQDSYGDHFAFLKNGIPSICVTQCDEAFRHDVMHTTKDTLAWLDRASMTRLYDALLNCLMDKSFTAEQEERTTFKKTLASTNAYASVAQW